MQLRGHVVFVNRLQKQLTATNERVKSESRLATPPRAVIHMGIHKTGSTTIQLQSLRKRELLQLDGYEMPWAANKENNARVRDGKNGGHCHQNQVHFATCFLAPSTRERAAHPCEPNLLLHGLDIAKRNHSLFVSAETFSIIDEEGVNMLASYLSHWQEVTIVVFYRRYYDWLLSVHNQLSKNRIIQHERLEKINFLSENALQYRHNYIVNTVQHLKNKFHKDDIVVLNYHDKNNGGSDESLFCHAVPDAKHMCNAIRVEGSLKTNSKINMDYRDLAHYANITGMVRIESQKKMKQVTDAIQIFHEKKSTNSELKRVCPPPDTLEKLWNLTFMSEIMFSPEKEFLDHDEIGLRSDFEKASVSTLCKVDVKKTLAEETWQAFFKNL